MGGKCFRHLCLASTDGALLLLRPRRDVKKGKKRGNEKAYHMDAAGTEAGGIRDTNVVAGEANEKPQKKNYQFWKRG